MMQTRLLLIMIHEYTVRVVQPEVSVKVLCIVQPRLITSITPSRYIGTKIVATTDLLTVYAATAGDTFTGVINFANTMGLGANTTGSQIILWPGTTTTDWYGLGMASSKMV